MADNKKSFLLYCDLLHTVKKLNDEQAGKLFKHVLEYVNDLNPETEDIITGLPGLRQIISSQNPIYYHFNIAPNSPGPWPQDRIIRLANGLEACPSTYDLLFNRYAHSARPGPWVAASSL